MMQLRGVSKSYALGESRVEALSEINLTIDDGDYLTIEGPSGSGKSTLLSILGCLERPTRGEYYLDERAVHEMGDRELSFARARTFGFVLQSFHLIPQLTALGNVMLPMRYVGMRKAERRERARALLAMVGLAERASHRPSQLSGGEQQRVAIARALANDPKVILADEPTGNLDTEMGEEIVGLLESFWKDGKALVIVTHNPEIARRSPKCIRLRNGRVESVLAENAQAG